MVMQFNISDIMQLVQEILISIPQMLSNGVELALQFSKNHASGNKLFDGKKRSKSIQISV